MKKLLFSAHLIMCLLFSMSLTAQNANSILRGKITDSDGQALPGASVVIKGTTIGVSTDVDGHYIITRLPEGEVEVMVVYIGYQEVQKTVTLKKNTTVELNFKLDASDIELDESSVSAGFQSYQRAVNYQRSSSNLRNVVSADQVGRFPDANIGDAMKRISGINVQYDQGEARFGQVRGTSPQFSSVTVNGNRMPSAEGDARSVQLDLVPSDMIQTIVVNKVVTADMDGDAIGGAVNLITKNSPSGRIFTATLGTGTHAISAKPQYNGSFTYGDRINNKLGFIVAASYSNNRIGSDNTEFEWAKDENGNDYVTDYQIRQYYVQRERQSYSVSMDYKFNLKHKIDFKGIYNRRNDWENRYRLRLKDIDETGMAEKVIYQTKGGSSDVKNTRLERQQTLDLSLNGEHIFGSSLLDWNLSYARASEERPDERYIAYSTKDVQFSPDYSNMSQPILTAVNPDIMDITNGEYELDELTESHKNIAEEDLKARVNYNIPILIGSNTGSVKLGGKVVSKTKYVDIRFYDYSPVDQAAFNSNMLGQLSNPVRANYLAGNYKVGSFVSNTALGALNLNSASFDKTLNPEEMGDNYQAREDVYSAFVRFDQKISDKFSLTAGIRAEGTYLENRGVMLDSEDPMNGWEDGNIPWTAKTKNNYWDILPSLLLRYDASKNLVLRASYTKTIARPDYQDVISYWAVNTADNELEMGNPGLESTSSNNIDLGLEYYYPKFGQISLGVYYKDINDFIVETTLRDETVNGHTYDKVKTPINGGNASLLGFEASLQRDLSFIAPALKDMGIYANYTYTASRITNFNIEREDINGNPVSNENLSLPGSPKHIANASLYYDNDRFSVRVSYNYASSFIDEFSDVVYEDKYYGAVNYLDVNASFTFAKRYVLFADATNLLNQPLRYYQGSQELTMQSEFYGPRFNIGLRITF